MVSERAAVRMVLLTLGSMIAIHCSEAWAQATASPPCNASVSAGISLINPPGILTLKADPTSGKVTATGHLYIRNDGSSPLSGWCARARLYDYKGAPQETRIALGRGHPTKDEACQDLSTPAGAIEDLTLTFEVHEGALPYSGIVFVGATGQASQKETEAQTQPASASELPSSSTVAKTKMVPCTLNPKQLSQTIVVPLADSASQAQCAVFLTGLFAVAFLIVSLLCFHKKLRLPMGSSQWSFSSSAATNLTVVGSLLGTALASSALPDFPHFMSKQTYIVLGILFAVLAGLTPVIYNFFCKPFRQNPANPDLIDFQGWVWLFLAADAFTIWAVSGQLTTLSLLFSEFTAKQHLTKESVWVVWGVAGTILVSLLFYCARTAQFYVLNHPVREMTIEQNPVPPRWTTL